MFYYQTKRLADKISVCSATSSSVKICYQHNAKKKQRDNYMRISCEFNNRQDNEITFLNNIPWEQN